MKDQHDRIINYLRLSVTDLCNLRCKYCMPEDGVDKREHEEILSVDEIEEIAKNAVDFGINKIRITGGEPLVRNGIIEICQRISAIEGIEELCLTSNGILLEKYAEDLKKSGVNRLNISLDTLDKEKYKEMTRYGNLETVLRGIKKARDVGFKNTKINAVLIGGFNDDEIESFVELTRDHDYQVRFIELMPLGECSDWKEEAFSETNLVLEKLPELKPMGNEGVARLYKLENGKGSVGLISPMSRHFCPTCNRIRVTADGKLKPCLHSDEEINIKGLKGDQLKKEMAKAIYNKPSKSFISKENKSSSHRQMNQIGG